MPSSKKIADTASRKLHTSWFREMSVRMHCWSFEILCTNHFIYLHNGILNEIGNTLQSNNNCMKHIILKFLQHFDTGVHSCVYIGLKITLWSIILYFQLGDLRPIIPVAVSFWWRYEASRWSWFSFIGFYSLMFCHKMRI